LKTHVLWRITPPEERPECRARSADDALARAAEYGVDLSQLRERLHLSPTERLRQHQRFLKFVRDLRNAATSIR